MKRLAAFLILLLTGCAASAQTRSASVNMAVLLPKHPLYGTLVQFDRQIAALQVTLHTRFANSGAQIDNANAAIRHDLDHASNATRDLSRRARPIEATLRQSQGQSAASAPSAGAIESGIQQAYNRQHSQLQGTAQRDMVEYRATLFHNSRPRTTRSCGRSTIARSVPTALAHKNCTKAKQGCCSIWRAMTPRSAYCFA